MNKGRVIYENEAEPHFRLAYPSPALAVFVDYYFEINQPATLANPLYLNALPSLSNLLTISLHAQSWLSINPKNGAIKTVQGSRFFGNLTELHTSIYPAGIHEFYVKFKPGILGRLFRIAGQEVENANEERAVFLRPNSLEERLQTARSFRERTQLMESFLGQHFRRFDPDYRFWLVQTALRRFGQFDRNQPIHLNRISRELGVSYPSLHRYFTAALGYSPKYCQKLIRFKTALQRYRQFGSQYSFEETGYVDFSHFVKDSRQLTQRLPSEL
ncbi:helix-turn-helix domain-containing protein [Larkinella ripae]